LATACVKDLDCRGLRVLIRVDFNVPSRLDGEILDDRRIRAALPTIRHVVDHGGIAIVMSHLGRPAGAGYEANLSLAGVATRLGELLGPKHPVVFVKGDCIGPDVTRAVESATAGQVLMLDNLRFSAGEKSNDANLGASLGALADAYVNDAFGAAHRTHASIVATPAAMEGKPCVAGLLLEKEIHFLSETLASPARPFIAILGGAKVSDKLAAIKNLLPRVDAVLVGGGMAYTFLKAQDHAIGNSLLESDMIDIAREILAEAANCGTDLVLPTDHVCAQRIDRDATVRTCELGIPSEWIGLDIGPETLVHWCERVSHAGTVVWNGPVGVFETPPFDAGTAGLAAALAHASKRHKTVTIVGGGETAAAVEVAGVASSITHVSTGGGASLQMLEGRALPGLLALDSV
jgi:phosphoglycerate kinase